MPDQTSGTPELRLVFGADPVAIRRSLSRMLASPPLSGLGAEARGAAELVLAEILNNVAEHAYDEAGGTVEVTLRPDAGGILCQIADSGRSMPDGRLPEGKLPASSAPLQDLPEGGFGWHLIRSLCADLSYTRSEGRNLLVFLIPG
ncbi:ATP-binding protein [Tabrizicola flagellatus]|uniref:ATP-binding protein n=1 Tax=Tabrizicola flagellatus TaxID=2593021 RepID=UPI00135C80BA|nr:ATP-binding protein [Tabrizicola flagellatus]